jgi:DNA-binding NarL/FixJ family response regulator
MRRFGDEAVAVLESVQPATIYRFVVPTHTGAMLAAGIWTLSREEAERQAGLILPMFTYHKPYLNFSAGERRVLQAALDGSTDASVAVSLGLSIHAVKATWTPVLRRIAEKEGLLCNRIGALRGDVLVAALKCVI